MNLALLTAKRYDRGLSSPAGTRLHTSQLRDSGTRRSQDYTALVNGNAGVGVRRHRQFKALYKVRSEFSDQAEPGPKLVVKGWPAYRDIGLQGVESVGEPDIHVDDH